MLQENLIILPHNIFKTIFGKFRTRIRRIRKFLTRKYFEKILYSHSQYGEDLIIDNFFKKKQFGVYMDIGANDPNILSSTKRFYLKGWRGVNVEPDSTVFKQLVKHRSCDQNLNIGIGLPGEQIFYKMNPSTLSTFCENIANDAVKNGYQIISKANVTLKPLSQVISDSFGETQIDFLSLDVEGYEIVVLMTNDWKRFRPTLLLVEINRNKKEIYDYLLEQNYQEIFTNGTNSIFASHSIQ